MRYHFLLVFLFTLTLCADEWSQFHANGPNNGFMPVQTSPAENPAWSIEVGTIAGTSPVLGPDGTVFVGNAAGILSAINPNGTKKWEKTVARGWSLSTPAVDETGNVYVSATFQGLVRDHRDGFSERFIIQSRLFCYSPDGRLKWKYSPGSVSLPEGFRAEFFFTSTPKIIFLEDAVRVFLVQSYWNTYTLNQENFLVVIHEDGYLEDARYLSEATFVHVSGGGGLSFSGGTIGPKPLPYNAIFPRSAVAIVDYYPNQQTPLIIAADDADAITAFRWNGKNLSQRLWQRPGSNTTFKFDFGSPAVFYNGNLLIGRSDGQVYLLNPESGEEIHTPWPRFSSGIYSTAASFLRQMYFSTLDGEVVMLDSDGEISLTTHLDAQTASSPAMSASFLYLNASDGLHTLTFELENAAHYEFHGGGTSSPAIGKNGTVYTLDAKTLYAFPAL